MKGSLFMLGKIKKHKFLVIIWVIALVVMMGFGWYTLTQSKSNETAPQTATVSKKTLTQVVSASGQVASSGQTSISTQASGQVTKVYVQVGSVVKKGDKIFEIEADQTTIQNQKTAWAAYLMAKNTLNQAKAKVYTLESAVLAAQQKFDQEVSDKNLTSSDTVYQQLQKALLGAQADLNNQQSSIAQAQSAVDSAYSAYQNTSTTVLAPAAGTIQDLAYEEGSYITSSGGSTGSSTSVATLKISDKLTVKINVSELDIAGVAIGQKVDLTMTALVDKTYHGRVINVASAGATDSGVTTFPVVIEITDPSPQIRVGMAVSSDITIQTKENVLAIPNQAISSDGDEHTVTVLTKDGLQKVVSVTVGLILDTESEIISGLSEGDKVILPSSNETSATSDDSNVMGMKPGGQ